MPVLSLPLTFNNSFWTQDYRKGLETVYAKLSQGIEEDEQIVNFVRARAHAERHLGQVLAQPSPVGPKGTGMDRDEGASLLVAFRGLQEQSQKQGEAHATVATELDTLVADPFEVWAQQHSERVYESKRSLLDGYLRNYEDAVTDVGKLKQNYISKARKADEAEDDVKFAPNSEIQKESLTAVPTHVGRNPRRGQSISERITAQIFGGSQGTPSLPSSPGSPTISIHPPEDDGKFGSPRQIGSPASTTASLKGKEKEFIDPHEDEDDDRPLLPKVDKGKGKEVITPPPPVPEKSSSLPLPSPLLTGKPTPTIVYAGVAFPVDLVPVMLTHAKNQLARRTVTLPLLGEYKETFTGEEFAFWLRDNVRGFGGSLDVAEVAAREVTERDGMLRRIGELGNKYENSPDAIYQFRAKAFEVPEPPTPSSGDEDSVISPTIAQGTSALLKRSGTVASYVAKALKSSGSPIEPPYRKARIAADEANEKYRVMVKNLDRLRLGLEEKIEATLKSWGRWELDRLRAVKTVLLQYQGTLAQLPNALAPSLEQSSTLLTAFQPEADLTHLIERYRTGPFRPQPHVYESIGHEKAVDAFFGIDLGAWAGEGGWNAVRAAKEKDELGAGLKESGTGDSVPFIVSGILEALKTKYGSLDHVESRKAWIYDVPLPALHQLREAVNALPTSQAIPADLLDKQDAPVLASTLKLWLLELDPALGTWTGWEDVRNMYPLIGAETTKETNAVEDLKLVLQRFPKIHLLVLDAIVHHLKDLIDSTTEGTEPTEVYSTKLALSISRAILRPQVETSLTIQDRHPTVFFLDLLNNYEAVLPPTIAHKKRDSGRVLPPMPVRKRTAPIDMRVHRSNLSGNVDPQALLHAQLDLQAGGSLSRSRSGSVSRPVSRPSSPPAVQDERVSRRVSFGFGSNQQAGGGLSRPRSKSPPSTLRNRVGEPSSIEGVLDGTTANGASGTSSAVPAAAKVEQSAPATSTASPTSAPSPTPAAAPPAPSAAQRAPSPANRPGNVAGPPGRPMFKDPPPEEDDLSGGVGATNATVIIVPDAEVTASSSASSTLGGNNNQLLTSSPTTSEHVPSPTALADTKSTGEPIKEAAKVAQKAAGFVPPPPPPPLRQDIAEARARAPPPPPPRQPSQPSPPITSPRGAPSPPIAARARSPSNGPRGASTSPRQSPSGSGRTTPTGGAPLPSAVVAARRSASPARQGSTGSTTPSRSSSLRRQSIGPNGSTTSLASIDSTSTANSGNGSSGMGRSGPRIVRGPRVAHRPTVSTSVASSSSSVTSPTGSGSGTPASGRPVSAAFNPGLKRRPLSGIGFVPRTMESSEDEKNSPQ